jgi:hypothetical protein
VKYTIDTNVAVVANGHSGIEQERQPTLSCRLATVQFLTRILKSGQIFVDLEGEIIAEYRRHLNPKGQPGVGDQFYREILNSHPNRIFRVSLPKRDDREFVDCPQLLIEVNFDPSDRKFAAMASKTGARVVNATDSDWINNAQEIEQSGIVVENLCGCDDAAWFED